MLKFLIENICIIIFIRVLIEMKYKDMERKDAISIAISLSITSLFRVIQWIIDLFINLIF